MLLRFAQVLVVGSVVLFLCDHLGLLHFADGSHPGAPFSLWMLMGISVLPTCLFALAVHYVGAFVHEEKLARGTDPVTCSAANPPQTRLARAAYVATICAFFLVLVQATDTLYLQRTREMGVASPANIIAGKSQAPNQYRVLGPLLWQALDKLLLHDPVASDRAVIFISILAAYLAAGALFYRSSHSMPITMLGLLALLGSFVFGMAFKYRQEFFETAFVSVALLTVTSSRRIGPMYAVLSFCTLLGSLNRETYVFCIMATAVYVVWHRVLANKEPLREHLFGILALGAIYVLCFVGPRWYFGLSHYHCAFWTYEANIRNLMRFTHPYNLGHLGAGLLFAYLTTVLLGNRWYAAFVWGYAVPMLLVATVISSFSEHRVFYPLMTLMIASMLGFLSGKDRIEAQ